MGSKKPASVLKNYLYSLSCQILLLIVPLITMPYLARTIGIDNQGTFSILYSVSSTFVMLGCVGLNMYGQREIAYHKNDPQERNRIFWEIELVRISTLLVSLVIYFAFAWFNTQVSDLVNVNSLLLFALFAIDIPSSMLDISWYYQGIEDFRLQTVRNFAVKLIGLVLILTLVKDRGDLPLYIVIYTGMNLFGNLSLWISKLREGFARPEKSAMGVHLRRSLLMFLPQIATIVYAQLDRVMVGALVDDGNLQAGVYDNAEKIVKIALTVVTSIALVMLSRVADTFKQNQLEKSREYIRKSFYLYTCLATPIMAGIMAIATPFVAVFFADADHAEMIAPVIVALCPIVLFIGGSSVFGTQYLLPTNRLRPYTLSVFTGMVVNVVFNLVFIPRFGALGAAFATALAELMVLIVQMVALRKEFSFMLYLRAWRNFLCSLCMYLVVRWIGGLLGGISALGLAVQVAAGAAVYFLLLFVLRDPFLWGYLRKIMNKLRHRG